jgi:dihydrofolate reductase
MKKLKLQVQMSIDGFVGGPNGELDFMTWVWDDKLKEYVTDLTDSVDSILLGRKMTDGFVSHWSNVVKNMPEDESYSFAKKMMDKPKFVFTKTLDKSTWENTTLAKGELTDEIKKLKAQSGKDIIVYGGAGFVSSLIQEGLIDEYYLFVNPSAVGNGLSIFKSIDGMSRLKLAESISFDCGIVLLKYVPSN